MIEECVGFDARILPRNQPPWSSERREQFLLNPKVPYVLSLDDSIWPSVLDIITESNPHWIDEKIMRPDDWWETTINLWGRLSDLLEFLSERAPLLKDEYWIVAVSKLKDAPSGAPSVRSVRESFDNAQLMQCLGYDVCDEDYRGGLSDFGWPMNRKSALRFRFGGSINKFNLFNSRDAACEFSEFMDQEASEHSPFAVFGLYAVSDGGMEGATRLLGKG